MQGVKDCEGSIKEGEGKQKRGKENWKNVDQKGSLIKRERWKQGSALYKK